MNTLIDNCFLVSFLVLLDTMPHPSSNIIRMFGCAILSGFLLISSMGICQGSKSKTIVELTVDNDIVFLIDRYYSSGIELSLYSDWIKKSPIDILLIPHGKNEIVYYSLSIKHRMFTPERTLTPKVIYDDHPYSTYFLMGNQKTSYNLDSRIKITSRLELGVIGPVAGGETIQNKLHDNIPIAQHSEGWHNQVKNDLCIQYSASIEKGVIHLPMVEANCFLSASLGVPHTDAHIGGNLRFGIFDDYFKGIGIDISPDFNIWLTISGAFYLVNYNATLQGGTYNQDNVHTINPINNTLLHGKIGGVIQYKRMSAEYGMEVRSPEFSTAYWHRWGHLVIAFAF